MNTFKMINLEYPILHESITKYTSGGNIKGILDGLGTSLENEDTEAIVYYFDALYDWYRENINEIRTNDFVSNKSDHERNLRRITELRSQLKSERLIQTEDKLKKGSILHTAFDDFRLLKIIGQGGNGIVFEAVSEADQHVAIKVVESSKLGNEKRKRFKNEINFCRNTQHQNIIQVLDSGSTDNGQYAFYVMPLYRETLRDRIKMGIQPVSAIEIFDSLMAGLEFAHDKNVFHRDIKPENIMFAADDNNSVIGDFGIAHFPAGEMLTAVDTKVGDRMANFQYAAPEQRKRGRTVDGRADVFAAGLILNEMLTGQIIGGSGYKKIGDYYPEYAFLDVIVEKLYLQDPNERLYPPAKIRQELRARIEIANNEVIAQKLRESLNNAENNTEEFVEYDSPTIIDAGVADNTLILKLSSKVPSEWYDIFQNSTYDHTSVMGYEPVNFKLNNGDEMTISLRNMSSRNTIESIVQYFKQWLPTVTKIYNTQRKTKLENQKREEIENIRREIETNERNRTLNEFVQKLI